MNLIRKISLKKINILLALVAVAILTQLSFRTPTTHAGGPLAVCQSGTPFVWGNGGVNIPFNPDQGDLGPVSNAAAVALVQQAFDVWGAVPTSTASYTNAGSLSVDVDITNFGPFLNPTGPDGISPIVFDDTGEIFDLLFGPGSGILGFAGPEFGNTATCTITEGSSFLNGPSFTDSTAAFDVMVHEFGHYSNLAHTNVNGQIFIGDQSGPSPNNTFGPIPNPFGDDVVETMYPFYFGPGIGTQTLEKDDVAALSELYPAPNFSSSTAAISGTIFAPNGTTKLTGVNIIARNVADPFNDAVSAISSDFTDGTTQDDAVVGTYKIEGLTPGANYAIYVDEILAGGFSTPPLTPLPGPEEFYNGSNESNSAATDDPTVFTPVAVSAGNTTSGIDIIFNAPAPNTPLPVGIDGSVEIFLPFSFEICQETYDSVWVNANGNVTFGAPSSDFTESSAELLTGPPRIAALWDDLNATAGGQVFYTVGNNDKSVTIHWENVPEFQATGSNTFSITLFDSRRRGHGWGNSFWWNFFFGRSKVDVNYGDLTATDGLGGVSCGIARTSSFEEPSDLSSFGRRRANLNRQAAVYEVWNADNPVDIANKKVRYDVKTRYRDRKEPNNSLNKARFIFLPFNSAPIWRYTELSPTGEDVDYYKFFARKDKTLIAEVQAGGIDSVLGLYDRQGNQLAFDDDGGSGLYSRIVFTVPQTGFYKLAVSSFPDDDFTGDGATGGRYVLDVKTINGTVLELGDDDSQEVNLGFSFPFQGQSYNSVFVNSNGNLTFGTGDTDFSESAADFVNGPPRIAPLWDDLSPNAGGLVIVENGNNSATITFDGVPEFFSTSGNTFSVTLNSSGQVDVNYGVISAVDGLAGVTEGGGATDPGSTDISMATVLSATGTTYELFSFSNANDLSGKSLSYTP